MYILYYTKPNKNVNIHFINTIFSISKIQFTGIQKQKLQKYRKTNYKYRNLNNWKKRNTNYRFTEMQITKN